MAAWSERLQAAVRDAVAAFLTADPPPIQAAAPPPPPPPEPPVIIVPVVVLAGSTEVLAGRFTPAGGTQ